MTSGCVSCEKPHSDWHRVQRLKTLGSLALSGANYSHQKPLLLLAFLALEGPQPRKRLATLFWPFASDPLNRLSVTVSRLNKRAVAALAVDGQRLATSLPCDVVELRTALASGDHAGVSELYQGRFLDGVDVVGPSEELLEWIEAKGDDLARKVQAHYLSQARTAAVTGSLKAAGALVADVLAITDAATLGPEQLVEAHDLLLASGEPLADKLLPDAEVLGLEPARTPAAARDRLKARLLAPSPTLPPGLTRTRLLGRDAQLELLRRLLVVERRSLVTVTGPGGHRQDAAGPGRRRTVRADSWRTRRWRRRPRL